MKKTFLVRHGAVDNPQGIVYKRLPGFHLSEGGRQEARRAAEFLRDEPLEVIFHSPLERTTETAQILNRFHGVPLAANEQIHEWDGVESAAQVLERMKRFWRELERSRYGVVAVVSHRDPIRLLLLWLAGEPPLAGLRDPWKFPLPTAGVYRVCPTEGLPEIELVFSPSGP